MVFRFFLNAFFFIFSFSFFYIILFSRIEVRGCMDLRGFALRCRDFEDLTKFGLKHLTERVLGRTLDKSPHVRLSNWEAETLDAQQTEYAANDALVATDIFRYEGNVS